MTEKKKVVPETNVSAGSVQDLINEMRGERTASSDSVKKQNEVETAKKAATSAAEKAAKPVKKGVVPESIVSTNSEIQKMREILTSGKEVIVDSNGTISEAGGDKKYQDKKAKTVPESIVS